MTAQSSKDWLTAVARPPFRGPWTFEAVHDYITRWLPPHKTYDDIAQEFTRWNAGRRNQCDAPTLFNQFLDDRDRHGDA